MLFQKIIVSRDGRISSPSLEKNLIDGLLKAGASVISIGMNPTPTLYFSNQYFNSDGAIQVTGSHNPKSYNGFKMIMQNKSFFGRDIIKLSEFAEKGSEKSYSGAFKLLNIEDIYIKEVLKPLEKYSNFKKLSEKNYLGLWKWSNWKYCKKTNK